MENDFKNKIKLRDEHIKTLSELPETGMGYQVVDILLKDGKTLKNRIVINSEFLIVNKDELLDLDMIQSVKLSR